MRIRLLLLLVALVGLAACASDPGVLTVVSTSPSTQALTTTSAAAGTSLPVSTTTAPTIPPTSTTTSTMPPPVPTLVDFELGVELVADDFQQPVFATGRPGDTIHLYVVEQSGTIVAIDLFSADRVVVLDIEARVRWQGERGLLGLAFHPTDPERLFVHYTGGDGATVLEEFRFDPATGVADPGSGQRIFTVAQPAGNHNGGMIAFGPDGYLYLGLGDGGGANDIYQNGQDTTTVLGTILRFDVDTAHPYAVPPDNPFADGVDGAAEIWAWGLRNPWRFSFDGTDLWVGDVGQDSWEEIDQFDATVPGRNAGWPVMEGLHCFRDNECDPTPFLQPAVEYSHGGGRCSVTGGAVYRGTQLPELTGTYLFGDYCTGEIWGLRRGDEPEQRSFTDPDGVHLPALPGLTSFGVGPRDEVYVMQASGELWRIVLSG